MKEKMKKLLKLFAVCTMAFVSCFTLFACKETPPTDLETEQTPSGGSETPSGGSETPSGSESNPSEGGQTPSGGTTVIEYTVSEEEWTTATNVVASENVTMTISQVSFDSSATLGDTLVMKFDGTTFYEKEDDKTASYVTKVTEGSETKYYQYYYDDNHVWKKTEIDATDYERGAGYMSFPGRFAYSENFQYNSETHEYEATNHIVRGQTFAKVILGFENKKCVKLYCEITGTGSATFTFVYGTTETITLPTITE